MQIEFNYWLEGWEQDWKESLEYAFRKMQERYEHDLWWSYGAGF